MQRLRIINASAARIYRLAIPGQKLVHVGSDGGLFATPREVDELLVANSERVEVLVRGGEPGSRVVLQTLPYDRYDPHTRPTDWDQPRDLLELRTSTDAPRRRDDGSNHAARRPGHRHEARRRAPDDRLQPGHDQRQDDGHETRGRQRAAWTRPRSGRSKTWSRMDHPFHLHGFRFQVLDRDGVPEPYLSWKDSVNVPKHGKVRIAVRFEDFAGKWMFHCHILDHEDMGMMGILLLR